MHVLTRDEILKADDLPVRPVQVPEWDGHVYVRRLTGTERDQFEASCVTVNGKSFTPNLANTRAKLCALAICDAQGKRLFTDADVQLLGAKSAAALDRVYAEAQALNALTPADMATLEGNSAGAPG